MSERIKVDLNTLRSIPALEIDPSKKYLFLADPRRFDLRAFAECDLQIDAVVIPVIPGQDDGAEDLAEVEA